MMILRRSAGVLRGQKALAAPIQRSCLRALSTEPTTAATATAADSKGSALLPGLSLSSSPAAYSAQLQEQQARLAELKKIPAEFNEFRRVRKQTRWVGTTVEHRYSPDDILDNPPADASLELLMASQAHMGHHTSLWNPANQRYIYGVRAGIHIIALETTLAHLRRAARVVEQVAYHGGLILFVGTRRGQSPIVVRAAELAGACHLFQKWKPGTITNRDQILNTMQLQIVDENDRPLGGFEEHLMDRRPVVPDLVVCLNPLENYTMLYECGLANVPTIGVVDTNADPTWVTYAIPANDDSLRAVSVIAGVLGRAGQRGQQKRLEDAQVGRVMWENPAEIAKFMRKQKGHEKSRRSDRESSA